MKHESKGSVELCPLQGSPHQYSTRRFFLISGIGKFHSKSGRILFNQVAVLFLSCLCAVFFPEEMYAQAITPETYDAPLIVCNESPGSDIFQYHSSFYDFRVFVDRIVPLSAATQNEVLTVRLSYSRSCFVQYTAERGSMIDSFGPGPGLRFTFLGRRWRQRIQNRGLQEQVMLNSIMSCMQSNEISTQLHTDDELEVADECFSDLWRGLLFSFVGATVIVGEDCYRDMAVFQGRIFFEEDGC